ncbi:MAG TPA: hypothetical protein VMR97_01865 [Acidimicrobiales bacterium]|nr:hypothetical protein [Acidimicrobiales bacterium]
MSETAYEDVVRVFDGIRGVRYGEVLAVYQRDGGLQAEVWGTQMLNECPQELWGALDPNAIAGEMGALLVKLNGPRHWVIDGIGQKVAVVEPELRDFGGLTMRRIATVDLGDNPAPTPYRERKVNRGAVFFFDRGKPVYELVGPGGVAYVMQAYCIGVDPTLTEADLPGLGGRLSLPDGWSYRTRVLDEELKVDTRHSVATVLQDELENSYTLPD